MSTAKLKQLPVKRVYTAIKLNNAYFVTVNKTVKHILSIPFQVLKCLSLSDSFVIFSFNLAK